MSCGLISITDIFWMLIKLRLSDFITIYNSYNIYTNLPKWNMKHSIKLYILDLSFFVTQFKISLKREMDPNLSPKTQQLRRFYLTRVPKASTQHSMWWTTSYISQILRDGKLTTSQQYLVQNLKKDLYTTTKCQPINSSENQALCHRSPHIIYVVNGNHNSYEIECLWNEQMKKNIVATQQCDYVAVMWKGWGHQEHGCMIYHQIPGS